MQPQRAHFFPQVIWKAVSLVNLVRPRGNFFTGKAAHRISDGLNLFAEIKIHTRIKHEHTPCY